MSTLYPWQEADWAHWQALRQRLPHGLLLKGMPGIGKFELALNFAHSLLCQQTRPSGLACGVCAACQWLAQGNHPDFRLLRPEADNEDDSTESSESASKKKPSKIIKVEQLRALEDFFNLTAHQGQHRVVVIYPAEALPPAAANALLKTLEEPTAGLLFILVSHKPQRLLPTLLSRCLPFAATLPSAEQAQSWLAAQGVSDPASWLAQCSGAPLAARAQAEDETGEFRTRLIGALSHPAELDVLALAEQLQRNELPQLVHSIQQWCYDLAALKWGKRLRFHPQQTKVLHLLAEKIDPVRLLQLQRDLLTARREAQHTLNPRLFIESLLFLYQQACRPR